MFAVSSFLNETYEKYNFQGVGFASTLIYQKFRIQLYLYYNQLNSLVNDTRWR